MHFDYGAAGPGGLPPATFRSTATQCLGIANSAQPAAATLTNLLPGTIYYYRLVATNGQATTTPPFTATFRTAPTAPSLSPVVQAHRRWRDASDRGPKLHKPPFGTSFRFSLSEAASVKLEITQRRSGRSVRGKCRATDPHHRNQPSCTHTATLKTLSVDGHAGENQLAYSGKLTGRPPAGPGAATRF